MIGVRARVEEEIQSGSLSTIVLAVIALLIPVIGFIMTLSHARAGETRHEQRWRKSHGVLYWVLIPALSGALMLGGYSGIMPRIYSVIGLIILSASATLSYVMQKKRESA